MAAVGGIAGYWKVGYYGNKYIKKGWENGICNFDVICYSVSCLLL